MKGQKIRLLHLITTFSVGGAEMHLLTLVKHMPRDRFDLTVAFFKEEAQEARSLVPDFQALGIPVVDLNMPYWRDMSALWRLYRLLKRNRFDIVHTHLFRADVFGPLLAKHAGGPVVVTTVHNTERFFQNPLVKQVLRIANRHVDQVIAISQAVKNALLEDVGLPSDKIRVIYYGIAGRSKAGDSCTGRDVLRGTLGIPKDAVVIGTVGRLARQKGQRYLIEAFGMIHRTHPETRLLIVGHDDEGLRPELEALAARLGVEQAVLLPGYINGPAAMSAMDIFVLPSLWEGFGLVLLEAMLAQLPLIATRVGAVPEIVLDGETGMLIPPADSQALARKIQHLLQNPGASRALGERGGQRVQQTFSVENMVDETIALYDELLTVRSEARSLP